MPLSKRGLDVLQGTHGLKYTEDGENNWEEPGLAGNSMERLGLRCAIRAILGLKFFGGN